MVAVSCNPYEESKEHGRPQAAKKSPVGSFLVPRVAAPSIRAVSQNPIGAEVVGINVKKIYILTYGLGVALAGIAGSLLTQFYTIYPTAGASFGFRALIVVVVGGLGSIPGAFFAGIFPACWSR